MEIYFVIELVKLVLPVCKAEIKNIYIQRQVKKKYLDMKNVVAHPIIVSFFSLFCCECFQIRLISIYSSAIFDIHVR